MRQNILHILSILFLLASCQQEEIPGESDNVGYLSLTGFELSNGIEAEPLTKAVDNSLTVHITGVSDAQYDTTFATGTAPERIELAAGEYTVKAYTEGYETATDAPSYCSEDMKVTITAGEIAAIRMTVPMYNVGITATFPDNIGEWFTTYSIALSYNGKEATLDKTISTAYFLPAATDTALTYTLEATNSDREQQSKEVTTDIPKGGMYNITFELGTSGETTEASN